MNDLVLTSMNAMINLSDEQYDLVDRLREYYTKEEYLFEEKHPICDEAADEIERLRQEIANLTQSGDKTSKQAAAAADAAFVRTENSMTIVYAVQYEYNALDPVLFTTYAVAMEYITKTTQRNYLRDYVQERALYQTAEDALRGER